MQVVRAERDGQIGTGETGRADRDGRRWLLREVGRVQWVSGELGLSLISSVCHNFMMDVFFFFC